METKENDKILMKAPLGVTIYSQVSDSVIHNSTNGDNHYSNKAMEDGKNPKKEPLRRSISSDVLDNLDHSYTGGPNHAVEKFSIQRRNPIQRVVSKNGVCNVVHTNIKYQGFQFISDGFTTLVELKWRYNLFIFTLSYVLSWLIFGIIWYSIAYVHGDIGKSELEDDFELCVYNVRSFTAAFLFSVETQTTIGYGYRSVTEECPHATILVVFQSVISYIINSIMLGLIFAKIARPKKRNATLKFSKNAVIAMRDGKLCFMFRVSDIRSSHLYEAHLKAYAIKHKTTAENETIPWYHHNMDLNYATGEDRIFLMWPLIIYHIIDECSPLYNLSAEHLASNFSEVQSSPTQLLQEHFEIMVILEGVVEQTGLSTQARTSYVPSEIKWGHRFASSVISLKPEKDSQYKVDYKKFDNTKEVPETPKQSAKEIHEAMIIKEKSQRKCEIIEQENSPDGRKESDILQTLRDLKNTLHDLESQVAARQSSLREPRTKNHEKLSLWQSQNQKDTPVVTSTEETAPSEKEA